MKRILSLFLVTYLCSFYANPAYARTIKLPEDSVQTIDQNVIVRIYAYKTTKHYTAVEIGFTNPTDTYVRFHPKEIYLDDAKKYSQPLLTMDEIRKIESLKPGMALFPTAIGVGLGIAALATSRASKDAAFGLAMGALTMGGAALLTKGFENSARQNKFIAFENNTLAGITRLPPGMTLGGVLYFRPTKDPVSITLITKTKSGKYSKKIFDLTQGKKSKPKRGRDQRNRGY